MSQRIKLVFKVLIASLILLAFAARAGAVEAPVAFEPPTTEDKIRATFPEQAATMLAIAVCESGGHQYEPDGVTPRYGRYSPDYGLFQLNAVHLPEAETLGIDVMTEDGNIAFARILYNRNGTGDWYSSEHCWNT